MDRIENGKAALLHHAAVLGMTTSAANNVKRIAVQANGTTRTKILRDSTALEWRRGPITKEKPKKILKKANVIDTPTTTINMMTSEKA